MSYAWVRISPPKDQTTLEGWIAARFGWRLYNALLQDLQREVLGRPHQQSPGRLRRAAHQEPVSVQCRHQLAAAEEEPEGHHLLIEEFQYPKLGPGMMWETLPRSRRRRAAGSS
jgi:protoporphyrinogen oxidase